MVRVRPAAVLLALVGCVSPDVHKAGWELLPDPAYEQGFEIRGLGRPDDDGGVKGVFRTGPEDAASPVWSLGQWASVHSLADSDVTRQTRLGKTRFEIANPSKRVVVDSKHRELTLALNASACYRHPRRKNESWPHLLAATSLTDVRHPSERCRVDALSGLDVALACRLTAFDDRHPEADPGLHAAQFQLFLYVQNLNTASPGYGDMLWFGVPVFDNRRPASEEHYQRDGGKADASGKFIYALPTRACQPHGNTFFKGGRIDAAPHAAWTEIRVDALPWILRAYALARQNGYLKQTAQADLYVSGLNIGWEMPGAYDAAMELCGFSLYAQPK